MKKILILAPHTDDGEFGCGATIVKFIESGDEVYYIAFTLAEESVPEPFPKDILLHEVTKATSVLGIKEVNLRVFRFKVRYFSSERQSILEELVKLNSEIHPDIVFIPALHDLHQDHSTIAKEALRAFKKTSILAYEMPWNNLNFATQAFISIEERHLKTKIEAIKCYKSQKGRDYASPNYIKSLATTRGIQIGKKYAEVFEVIRWII